MRFVTAGTAEIIIIYLLYCGVVMGTSYLIAGVRLVKYLSAFGFKVYGRPYSRALNGLSAAVYAASGTSHDFDEINFNLACFYLAARI